MVEGWHVYGLRYQEKSDPRGIERRIYREVQEGRGDGRSASRSVGL